MLDALSGIVLLLADDMGQWAASPYGNREILTPTLARLAKEGALFTNAVANTPVCSASRASLLTGRVPSQHGVHDWLSDGNGCSEKVVNYTKKETFYTDRLAAHGFKAVGLSGKYHLGNSQFAQHGFSWWQFVHQRGGGSYTEPDVVVNGSCVTRHGYVTDMIADDAIRFVKAHARDAAPFYLSVHFTSPHAPYVGYDDGKAASMHPPAIVALYDNASFTSVPSLPFDAQNYTAMNFEQCFSSNRRECLKGYFSAVTAMDGAVDRVLGALEDERVLDTSLVIFTSDHGFNTGHHGLWGKGNAAWPLNMLETSLKVPLIYRWPSGGVRAGAVSDLRVGHVDFAPTLLELAKVPSGLPHAAGSSYASTLLGLDAGGSRLHAPPRSPDADDAAAAADADADAFAPSFHEYGGTRAVRGRHGGVTYKLVVRSGGRDELYNLDADADEADCLLARGEPSVLPAYAALRRSLMGWFDLRLNPLNSGWERPVAGKGQNDEGVAELQGVVVQALAFEPLFDPPNHMGAEAEAAGW